MMVDVKYSIIIIAICVAVTQLERFFPFLIFRGREVPPIVTYLGKLLPMAIMATLVIYCIKDISFLTASGWLPYLIACGVTAGLHLWRHSALLSIVGGTACYMLLVQLVF